MSRIFIVCTGLGIVKRGFESYIELLSEKLSEHSDFKNVLTIFSAGTYKNRKFKTQNIRTINRKSKVLYLFTKNIYHLFEIEQIFFFLFFIPYVLLLKPTAIYLGEYKVYCYLYKLRKLFKLKFSLILYTGGQAYPGLFDNDKDFVHHITDIYFNQIGKYKINFDRQFLIPHFIESDIQINDQNYKDILLMAKGRKIVLSVGSIDNTVKRIDKLIDSLLEVKNDIFLILLGDSTSETENINNKLAIFFEENNYLVGQVERKLLPAYYSAASVLASFSLKESFGLVNIEAMLCGTPVVCHDYLEAKFVLKNHAEYLDLSKPKISFKNLIQKFDASNKSIALHQFVESTYSWNALSDSYIKMFKTFIHK